MSLMNPPHDHISWIYIINDDNYNKTHEDSKKILPKG